MAARKKPARKAGRAGRRAPSRCGADLEAVRARIDAVDEEIHALHQRARAPAPSRSASPRPPDGRTVDFYRPEREAQVLRMARARNKGPLRNEEVLRLFREIMSACLAQQEPLKVAFLGPKARSRRPRC